MTDPIQLAGMMPSFDPVQGAGGASVGAAQPVGKDFRSILLDSLEQVDRLQKEADAGVQKLVTGETQNVAEVFTAVNKAGIAFDLLMEVRNKLTKAYEEVQQMRV